MPNKILNIKYLDIGYNKIPIIEKINTSILENEIICFIGRNGMGKTTLLKSLCGLIKPICGSINIFGRLINSYKPSDLAKLVSIVLTHDIRSNMKIEDLVMLGRIPHFKWHGNPDKHDKEVCLEIMENFNLGEIKNKKINEVSDGELKKASIARSIAQETPIILMDEPSAFLDLKNKIEVFELIKKLKNQGKTIIFTTHDIKSGTDIADKIWMLDNKKLIVKKKCDFNIKDIEAVFNENIHILEKYF